MRATPEPISDADEARAAELLLERLSYVDLVLDRHAAISSRTPAAWSQLGSDDAATGWLQVSHQLMTILGMVGDNLRVAREMLVQGDRMAVPMYGHYPVIRSIIEAAALVTWIAEPDEQRERLRRSLSARIEDLTEDKALHEEALRAAALHGGLDADQLKNGDSAFKEGDAKARRLIRGICAQHDIPWSSVAQGLPGYARIIRAVPHPEDVPANYAASIWRILSGLSHPSASRATRYSAVEVLGEAREGILNARLSASVQWTHAAMLMAISLSFEALSTVERRLDTRQPRRTSAFGSITT